MLLKESQIKQLIKIGSISIEPFDVEFQLHGSYIDLRLSDRFYRYPEDLRPEVQILDPENPYFNILERDYISDKGIVLEPGGFYIFETLEYISIPENISIFLQPKLRLSRLGINLLNSGWIGYGYEGNLTLCVHDVNAYPVRIFKDMPIVHIFLSKSEL